MMNQPAVISGHSLSFPRHRFSDVGGTQLLTLELPSLDSIKDADLDIGETEIRLRLPGCCEYLLIPLPAELSSACRFPTAKFSRKRGELTIAWGAAAVKESVETLPTFASNTFDLTEDSSATVCFPELSQQNTCSVAGVLPLEREADAEIECLEFLQDEVEDSLKQCTVKNLQSIAAIGHSSVMLSDFAVDGQAHIKKRCCLFKASLTLKWEVLDSFGGFLGAAGTVEVADIAPDELAPKVVVKVLTCGSSKAKAAAEWMRKIGGSLISQCLNGENLRAAVLDAWDDAASDDEPETTASAPTRSPSPRVPLIQWAQGSLENKFASLRLKFFGGAACAHFGNPRVSGDISISADKGKRMAVFKLRVDCPWTITTSASTTEGNLVVPELTPCLGPKEAVVQIEESLGKKASGQLLTVFRQTGVSAIRKALAQFLHELEQEVQR